ncbi:MAG: hypothetical protein ACOYJ6_01975 [Caulobacterales bacterium]
MRAMLLAVFALMFALWAVADTPSHVMKFRAFQEALNRGEMTTANTLGSEALQQAQANGVSPSTIQVLAVNLAGLRLTAGLPDASTPLAQAVALAGQGQSAEMPATLELLQAWAGLDKTAPALTRLKRAIESGSDVDISWRWAAAQSLAGAASEASDGLMLHKASELGLAAVEGANLPIDAARGRVLTLRAAAALMGRRPFQSKSPWFSNELDRAVNDARDAVDLLDSFADPATDGQITLGVRLYAEAKAWHSAISSLRRSMGTERASDKPKSNDDENTNAKANLCRFEMPKPRVEFPEEAVRKGYVGGVTALVFIGPTGISEDVKILAEVPAAKFSDAVRKGMLGLPFKVKQGQNADCRRSYWYFYTFNFVFR